MEKQKRERDELAGRFNDLCDAFVKDQSKEWRPSTRKGWLRFIDKEIKPGLGEYPTDEVTPEKVRALVDKMKYGVPKGEGEKGETAWQRKPAPTSARRCFEVLRRMCAWAVWKGYLPRSPCAAAQPFERRRRGRRNVSRSKPYTDDQLRALFAASQGTELEHIIDLIARTSVRAHEARAARFEDIDRGRKLWKVPPEMHKVGDTTGVPHLVPLSSGALRCMRNIVKAEGADTSPESGWLFPAPTGPCEVCEREGHADKANKASAAVKAAAQITDRGLLHRLRDTIKTRMSEHGISDRVSEHILGHVVPGIAGIYDHAEMLTQRREALQWWDAELDRILKIRAGRSRGQV